MTPEEFIRKWKASTLKERSGSQEHFIDLCSLLGQPTPATVDATGSWYCFEKGINEIQGGGNGFADVWMQDHFGWEYKGKHANLEKAYEQLLRYRGRLGNPPLLVVCDMEIIELHTNFTNTPETIHTFRLEDLQSFETRERLKSIFAKPDNFKPERTLDQITAVAAEKFAELAESLRKRGHEPHQVAHYLSKVLFCLFAEDVGLLPKHTLTEIIEAARADMGHFNGMLRDLLLAMNEGGRFGTQKIRHFNGGLFNDDVTIPLEFEDTKVLKDVADLDWGKIEPSIFGTMFERGLDPSKRSQLGAHYTPRSDIERLVDPVVMEPLRTEWADVEAGVRAFLEKAAKVQKAAATKYRQGARKLIADFLSKVRAVRVLDPACGSGNFLYVTLERLHDLEKDCLLLLAEVEHGQMSLDIQVGPQQVLGIEINPYAFELAKVTVWIGHLQWMLRSGFGFREDPVLQPLDTIQNRDAIVGEDGSMAVWPRADYIIGNPPFLGRSRLKGELGDTYVNALRAAYRDSLDGVDLVCYWFEKARKQIENGFSKRCGFVSTNSIRAGANRKVIDSIKLTGRIFYAWSDEPWIVDGAAVRISLVCFDGQKAGRISLNGNEVVEIFSDLSGGSSKNSTDITKARLLSANEGLCFEGPQKNGPFEISGDAARRWLLLPTNPNGRPNADVLKPWRSTTDLAGRSRDLWIIDFASMTLEEASFYEAPFEHVKVNVKPQRDANNDLRRRSNWWKHGRSGNDFRKAIRPLSRYIATPRVSKHRFFVWQDKSIWPDSRVNATAREDDECFGILQSKIYLVWTLATCSWHGVGNDPTYNANSVFGTFPFPDGFYACIPSWNPDIAKAGIELNRSRDHWLNPPELVLRQPEVVPGYPERVTSIDDKSAKDLKQRTMTALYNKNFEWLKNAHRKLDEAVASAYGWEADLTDDEILRRLLALNGERASGQALEKLA